MNNMNRPPVNMRRTLRMNTGGGTSAASDWATRNAQANEATSASSIVKDGTQQAAQSAMLARNPGVARNRTLFSSPGALPTPFTGTGAPSMRDASGAAFGNPGMGTPTPSTMAFGNPGMGTPTPSTTAMPATPGQIAQTNGFKSYTPVGANATGAPSLRDVTSKPFGTPSAAPGVPAGFTPVGSNPGVFSNGKNSFGNVPGLSVSKYTGPTAGGTPGNPSADTMATMNNLMKMRNDVNVSGRFAQDNSAFANGSVGNNYLGSNAPAMPAAMKQEMAPGAFQVNTAHVGLRNGGDLKTGHGGKVPGKGKGDKVKALYEPGEFVVSNAMLEAEPGLREQLHTLRGEVLASQGKSVEQADAEAMGGKTLRANSGWTQGEMFNKGTIPGPIPQNQAELFTEQPKPAAPKYTPPPVDSTGQYIDGRRGAGNPNLAGGAGQTIRAGVSLEPTAGGLIRDRLLGSSKDWSKAGELANKARNLPGVGMAGTLLKGVAAPVSAYQTYQDVQKGDYGGAAVHGVDTAAGAALFTPAAPIAGAYLGARTAYESPQLIRDQLGESGLDAVGGTINQIGLRSGLWGTDDSAHLASKNSPLSPPTTPKNTARHPAVAPTSSATSAPTALNEKVTASLRNLGDTPEILAQRKVERDAQTQKDIAYGNQMEADRLSQGPTMSVMGETGGYGILDKGYQAQREAQSAMRKLPGESRADYGNRLQAMSTAQQLDQNESRSLREDGTTRRGQDVTSANSERQNQTTLRGHQMEMDRARITANATLRKNQFDMQRDLRKEGREQAVHDQTVGDKARESVAKEFTVYDTDKEGRQVANPKASAESLDALRSILPGMTSTDSATREAALSDAKAMHGIFLKARKQDPVGWEAMKIWRPARPELSSMPDVERSSTELLSGLSGAMTLNAENGDTILRQKDGRQINLQRLTEHQRNLLAAAQQRGWGN